MFWQKWCSSGTNYIQINSTVTTGLTEAMLDELLISKAGKLFLFQLSLR